MKITLCVLFFRIGGGPAAKLSLGEGPAALDRTFFVGSVGLSRRA